MRSLVFGTQFVSSHLLHETNHQLAQCFPTNVRPNPLVGAYFELCKNLLVFFFSFKHKIERSMGVSTRAPVVSSTPLAGTTQVLAVSAVTQRGELVKAYAAQPVFFRGTLGGCVSKVPHKFGQGLCRPSFQEKWCHRPFFFPQRCFS